MKLVGFKIEQVDLDKAKNKAGLLPLAWYIRTLILMWLADEVSVTEQDIRRHNARTR